MQKLLCGRMYIVESPAALFFLTSIDHTFAETLSKIGEGSIITGIVCNKPSNDGTDSGSGVLFSFIVTVDNSTLGCGDVCCYLLGGGTFEKFLRIVSEEKLIARATLILKQVEAKEFRLKFFFQNAILVFISVLMNILISLFPKDDHILKDDFDKTSAPNEAIGTMLSAGGGAWLYVCVFIYLKPCLKNLTSK